MFLSNFIMFGAAVYSIRDNKQTNLHIDNVGNDIDIVHRICFKLVNFIKLSYQDPGHPKIFLINSLLFENNLQTH